MFLPAEIIAVLAHFQPAFTQPSYQKVVVLLVGTILARGRRTVTVAVPLARPGFLTAAVLGFAHTLGEFGVVLMVGGNIPGSTQVVSIAIYNHVEALEYAQAHQVAGLLLVLSFALLGVFPLAARKAVALIRARRAKQEN